MALIFMPKKAAYIWLLILGTICLIDGIYKKDTKEILVGLAILIYAGSSLVIALRQKKKPVPKKDSGA